MNDEVFYGRENLGEDNKTTLDYYMIRESIGDSYCNLISYGVKVVKTIRMGGGSKTVELKQINNIFYCEDEAVEFIELIKKNTVTPISLMEVIEDYIIDFTHKETA